MRKRFFYEVDDGKNTYQIINCYLICCNVDLILKNNNLYLGLTAYL